MECITGHQMAEGEKFCKQCGSQTLMINLGTEFLSPQVVTTPGASAVSGTPRNSNRLKIGGFLFLGAGVVALLADFVPGVSTPGYGGLNAYKLGPNGTQIASAHWLLFLSIYSFVMCSIMLRGRKYGEWTIWLRAALTFLYLTQGIMYFNYCSNFVLGYNRYSATPASIAAAPILAIFAALLYGAGSILLIVDRKS
jgi:hypothetical protein